MDQKETLRQLTENGGLERLIGVAIAPVNLSGEDTARHWQKIMEKIGSTDSASFKTE